MKASKRKKQAPTRQSLPSRPTPEPADKLPLYRRLIHLAIVTVAIPLLVLGLIEVGLRIGGYGYPTNFFVRIPGQAAYMANLRYGCRFFPRTLTRPPLPMRLSENKHDNGYRIFVLGASAAQGYPAPSFGFDRILAVMLNEAYPSVDWQVINTGVTAINSHVVLPIARDCARHDPDMFIVYLGNNEVVGPYGAGSIFQDNVPSVALIRAGLAVKTTRLGQLADAIGAKLRGSAGSQRTEWRGMTMFLDRQVAADDPRMANVYEHFRRNLEDICDVAADNGADVLLCTVPVNLKDNPPFASQHRADLGQAELTQWKQTFRAGVAAEAAGQNETAIEQYLRAGEIDDRYAELHFRLGRCYLALGQADKALASFTSARDLDALRFRADSHINDIIRRVAAQLGSRRAHLVDTEKVFGRVAETPGLPGDDLFYEHVHLEFAGNYQLARAMFEKISSLLPASIRSGNADMHILSEQQCAQRLALTIWDQQWVLDLIIGMTGGPPFTGQLDHGSRLLRRLARRTDLKRQQAAPDATDRARRICRDALAHRPDDMILHYNFGILLANLGDHAEAQQQLQIALASLPGDPEWTFRMGTVLWTQGKAAEAGEYFQRFIKTSPSSVKPQERLADFFMRAGQPEKALSYALEALDHRPDQSQMYYVAGNSHLRLQELPQAIAALRKAIKLDPRLVDAYCDLAAATGKSGRVAEASGYIDQAALADPYAARPCFLQAQLLAAGGKTAQAEEKFLRAIRLQPTYAQARAEYAAMMIRQGRFGEASNQYRQSLVYDPESWSDLYRLARLLVFCPDESIRDPAEALGLALQAAELTDREHPGVLEVLAVAYAEDSQFDQAVEVIDEALPLARSAGHQDLVAQLHRYRGLFRVGLQLSNDQPAPPPGQ